MWSVIVPCRHACTVNSSSSVSHSSCIRAPKQRRTSMVWLRVMRRYDAAVSTMKFATWACGSTITVALRFESGSMRHNSPNVAPGVSVTTLAP